MIGREAILRCPLNPFRRALLSEAARALTLLSSRASDRAVSIISQGSTSIVAPTTGKDQASLVWLC